MMNLWKIFCETLPFEWVQYSFMQNALLAVILLAPLFALPGCLVVNNRMAFFSDAMGHAALTGVAIGVVVGITNHMSAMLVFAVIIAAAISLLRRVGNISTDTITGIVMTGSMALGIVILSRRGGFNRYSRYLIGDILSVTPADLFLIACALCAVIIIWLLFFNKFYLISVSENIAKSRGISIWKYDMFFSVIIALIVTLAVQWIGILVVSSLLILPGAAARNISKTLRGYVAAAIVISFASAIFGLVMSYYIEAATGATIVLTALMFYIVTLAAKLKIFYK